MFRSLDLSSVAVATGSQVAVRFFLPVDATQSHLEAGHDSILLQRRALLEELVSKGVRLTAQRRALIEVIQEASEHLDAASLLELARQREPNIDRATVYRTLELLKKLRLIDELDLMHLYGEKHYYEAKTERNHAHLACFRCGRIEEYSEPAFRTAQSRDLEASRFHDQGHATGGRRKL